MRRAILFLLLAGCALGSTTSAQATVLYSVPANGTVIFTDDHVEYLGDIFGFGEGCFDWVSGCEQLSGSYQIVSPLLSLSLTQPDAQGTRISDYEFGAGTLVVWLGWTNPDGSQGSGQITAVVAPYSLFATEYSASDALIGRLGARRLLGPRRQLGRVIEAQAVHLQPSHAGHLVLALSGKRRTGTNGPNGCRSLTVLLPIQS